MIKRTENTGTLTRSAFVRDMSQEQIEKRIAEFVISTEAVDTYGTVFRIDGWDLSLYEQNPVVLYAHQSWSADPDVIIGRGEVFVEDGQLIGRVIFESGETNQLAEKVFRKVEAGILRMASIGANVREAHWGVESYGEDPDVLYFDKMDLLEWSIVPIGSNPEALKRSTEALEDLKQRFPKSTVASGSLKIREYQNRLNKLKFKI